MKISVPMVVHSSSMSQGGPFGGSDDDKIWFTLTSPPATGNVLEREQAYTPPDTSINLSLDRERAAVLPVVGSRIQVTLTFEGD